MTGTPDTEPPVEVLLVEDNPREVRLLREVFAEVGADVSLTVAGDGAAALDRLRSRHGATDDLPHFVLLDLDLPETDGHEVLAAVKSDEDLRHVPVIVFTTSDDATDVTETYANHANAFVTKPDTAGRFVELVDNLQAFWLSSATLPTTPPHR